jgi:hypothetical protein
LRVNFGIRWEDRCVRDLERIYGSHEAADTAMFTVDWLLSRNPLEGTWELTVGNPVRLVWVKDFLDHPAVYLSFRIVDEPPDRYCLMLRALRANDPSGG